MLKQGVSHEDCLKRFISNLQDEVRNDLSAWKATDPDQAQIRQQAYCHVFAVLKRQAVQHNVPLGELGLADYTVPELDNL